MENITHDQHKKLIHILEKLIQTIELMKKETTDYLLLQNDKEAHEWLDFLKKHMDKEELKTLEDEISDRFFFKFDVQILDSELDNQRVDYMKEYIFYSSECCKLQ